MMSSLLLRSKTDEPGLDKVIEHTMERLTAGYSWLLAQTLAARSAVLLVGAVVLAGIFVFAGSSMAVAGMIMQMLSRNRFVQPGTAGMIESATLGLLAVTLF